MDCRNCQEVSVKDSNYCPQCGAKVVRDPLSFRSLFQDVWKSLTNVERGLWATMRDLTLRPGKVILGYLGGLRKRYTSPGSYALIVAALYGIMAIVSEDIYMHEEMLQGVLDGSGNEVQESMQQYLVALRAPLLFLPVLVIFLLNRLFYRRQQSPVGHAVISLYYYAHALLFYLLILLALTVVQDMTTYKSIASILGLLSLLVAALFCKIKIYQGAYQHHRKWQSWAKPTLLFIVGLILNVFPYVLLAIWLTSGRIID